MYEEPLETNELCIWVPCKAGNGLGFALNSLNALQMADEIKARFAALESKEGLRLGKFSVLECHEMKLPDKNLRIKEQPVVPNVQMDFCEAQDSEIQREVANVKVDQHTWRRWSVFLGSGRQQTNL